MLTGAHAIIYSSNADADRAFSATCSSLRMSTAAAGG